MKNESGVTPVEYKVVIKKDDAEKTTEGGIIIPETLREQDPHCQTTGTLVAMGERAFEDFGAKERKRFKPGVKVMVTKYAGTKFQSADRVAYFICKDIEITAILEETNE